MNNEYLTPQDVALILKVCPKTVLKLIKDKRIHAIEVGGKQRKRWRILQGELDRFAAREYEKYYGDKNEKE